MTIDEIRVELISIAPMSPFRATKLLTMYLAALHAQAVGVALK